MNEILITDLVSQQALDQLDDLDRKMGETLEQFKECAMVLAKGIKIPIEVNGDLERLRELSNATMQRAGQAAQQYTQCLQQQQQVIANTTNTISRQLMEQEKLNKAQREAYTEEQRSLDMADRILGTHQQNVAQLTRYNKELKQLKDSYKAGTVSAEEYTRRELELKAAKSELQRILSNETKMMQAAEGSYTRLSLQLERMKMAQKQLNEEEKRGAEGQMLEHEIQQLDAHLKDLAADMGEFQRNVGNYAIGAKSLRAELKELTTQMAQMLADGVDPTSEHFIQVAERAGQLKDAMGDAQATVNAFANDTQQLTQTGSVLQTAVGGWRMFSDAMRSFGVESNEAAVTTQRLMGITAMMTNIQKISTEVTTNGTGAYRAYHAILKLLGVEEAAVASATATEVAAMQAEATAAGEAATAEAATATATEAATVASGQHTAAVGLETTALTGATTAAVALKLALAALGIGAVVALIVTLYDAIKEFNSDAEKAAEQAKAMSDAIKDGEKSTAGAAAELRYYVGVVDDFNGSLEEEKKLVDELNSKYGDTLGYYQSLAQWKSTLASISEYYIDVLKWEAIAQANLNKYAEAYAEGNYELADSYEAQFEFYKKMASAQARVVQNLVKIHGGGSKPTSGGGKSSRGGSSKSDNGAKDAEKQMKALIDEANEMLLEWESTASKRAIAMTALITTTSVEAYKEQVKRVKALYGTLEDNIIEEQKKELAEKQNVYNDAIDEAKKYGKDTTELEQARITAMTAIGNDYQRKMEENAQELKDTLANMQTDLLDLIQKESTARIAAITTSSAKKVQLMRQAYLEELELAGTSEEEIARVRKQYKQDVAEFTAQTAISTAKENVRALEEMLKVETLTDEDRQRIYAELTKAKIALAKAVNDAEEIELNHTIDNEKEAAEKRKKLQDAWINQVKDSLGKVADLIGQIYDNQISKIEELIDQEQLRHEKEIENIEDAAERGAITKEEAEIRKREAEKRTAKQQEALEKRKAELAHKRAVVEKANSASEAAINTAVAIMAALKQFPGPAGIALAALVGAMGAVQIATILAQPIQAYAEGTKGKPHPGGLALVGEGGSQELVMYNGKAWVTPDKPTLLDLPRGAEVFPDFTKKDLLSLGASLPTAVPRDRATGQPIIINDYSALENRMAANTKALSKELRIFSDRMARELKRQKFNAYIERRT